MDDQSVHRAAKGRHYLGRAERAAGLPHLERGGFHTYRRLWASERKGLPDVDVAKAGGWRDLATMKRSYQQPDPATVLQAIQHGADVDNGVESTKNGHTSGTASEASRDSATG